MYLSERQANEGLERRDRSFKDREVHAIWLKGQIWRYIVFFPSLHRAWTQYRTLDMRGCVLLIFKLRQELDGALLPVNSKLRLLEKKFNSKFWWRHLHQQQFELSRSSFLQRSSATYWCTPCTNAMPRLQCLYKRKSNYMATVQKSGLSLLEILD